MARIAVFGAGYAGLVTGVCFAELGHIVAIRDVVPEKIERLREGETPIFEPGLEELMARNGERLRYTLEMRDALEGAEFLFVCVGTPPTYSGDADLSAVWSVIDELPEAGTRAILVMKSTVPVGTGEKVRAALDARGLVQVGYVSCPEFLAEGTAVRDFLHPDRIVIGAFDEAAADAVEALHEGLNAPIVKTDVQSAEMVKLAANAYLGTRISFINEIANVCELVGADVEEVARGMGLDRRIGAHYLRAGIGFGGSCLCGEETVLVRSGGEVRLVSLERLFDELAPAGEEGLVEPDRLEVLSWREGGSAPEFLPVAAITRRWYDGDAVEIRTKMGRRIRCTADHPFVVGDGEGGALNVKTAAEINQRDWLPVAQGAPDEAVDAGELWLLAGLESAGLGAREVIVRASPDDAAELTPSTVRAALAVRRSMRGTAPNGTYVPAALEAGADFWRIVGLYIAEGHCSIDGARHRLYWSFHPDGELDVVEDVLRFWRRYGVEAHIHYGQTSTSVVVSSRLLAGWWLGVLGLGRTCYEQRLPDLVWTAPQEQKRALLGGLWLGDGSWSYANRGSSVVLEYGTASRELADGVLRLLGDLGIVARLNVGRTRNSTADTYWITVSGAGQVDQLLDFVPEPRREEITSALARTKRIAPTGYRRLSPNGAWVRVVERVDRRFEGFVYSLEVPASHTFVTTGGVVVHNCFPKDISFLKLLAGNSGYHFQLLNAVIEVNELQKRRVVSKLQKHLGQLRGKRIALLGLAFKANTDDMREAPSIVLASRLLAEGSEVRAWDPVAEARARLQGVAVAATVAEAVEGADAAVVVTEWPQLRDLDWEEVKAAMRNPLVIDGRNLLDPEALGKLGFAYEGIGRVSSPFAALPEIREREPEFRQ